MNDFESADKKILVEAKGLNKSYKTKREIIHVLNETDLKLFSGEILGIVGASGVGKSTFIETFGKLLTKEGKKVAVLAIDPTSYVSRKCDGSSHNTSDKILIINYPAHQSEML